MRLSLSGKIGFGIGGVLILLAIVGAASYLSIVNLIRTQDRVEDTLEVLNTIARTQSGLNDLQRMARGFVITGDEKFVATFEPTFAAVDRKSTRLNSSHRT